MGGMVLRRLGGGEPPPPVLVSMGMHKTGNQSSIPRAWTRIGPMVVLSGYPETVIEDNCLVMSGPGRVRITYRAQISVTGFGYTISKRCTKNGVAIHSANDVVTAHTVDTDVVAGDRIAFEMSWSGNVFTFTLTGNTTTYMRADVI